MAIASYHPKLPVLTSTGARLLKMDPLEPEASWVLCLPPSYDVVKIKGNPDIALYTKLLDDNGKDFAVQALPDDNIPETVIPIGIDVAESAVYEFTAWQEHLDDFSLILEDRQENVFTDLRWDSYFATISESGFGRFYLHFKDATAIGETAPETNISIRYLDGKIIIRNPDQESGTISLVNVSGQVMMRKKIQGDAYQEFFCRSCQWNLHHQRSYRAGCIQ